MTNSPAPMPSAEAVNSLVALERGHLFTKSDGITSQSGSCWDCWRLDSGKPCPKLTKVRESASEETRIAVALILGGERTVFRV